MMVALDDMRIMDVMATATNRIAEGEVLQLMNAHDPGHDRGTLFRRHLPQDGQALRSRNADRRDPGGRRPQRSKSGMARYGRHLGTAFQLIDDVLDYRADRDATRQEPGRRPGRRQADAASYICAENGYGTSSARSCAPASNKAAPSPICRGSRLQLNRRGALRTLRASRGGRPPSPSRRSPTLPDSAYKQALRELADFAVERTY